MFSENSKSFLGKKLQTLRKQKGWSQEALAENSNISLSTIQRIEKGKVSPRPYSLKILAETLEIDISELTVIDTYNSKDSNLKTKISLLKKMNLSALILSFLPLMNVLIPLIIWKRNKKFRSQFDAAGKTVSFQLLWSFLTFIFIFIVIFLSNLISGNAGGGLYYALLFYLIAVIINILFTAKIIFKVNKENLNIFSFVPNLF